jgi:hypothetical protein
VDQRVGIEQVSVSQLKDALQQSFTEADEIVEEVEESSKLVRQATGTTEITAALFRWEALRSDTFVRHWKVLRRVQEARDVYYNSLRGTMKKGPQGKDKFMAFEERKAVYEATHIVDKTRLDILEQLEVDLKQLLTYLNNKIRWGEDMRREFRKDIDREAFMSKKDYQ